MEILVETGSISLVTLCIDAVVLLMTGAYVVKISDFTTSVNAKILVGAGSISLVTSCVDTDVLVVTGS